MKVYRITSSGEYRTFGPKIDTKENRTGCRFDGSFLESWKPIHLTTRPAEQCGISDETPDLNFVSTTTPLLTPKAFDILYPYLKPYSQFFETTTDYGNMFLVNVTNINDCLDYKNCELKYFSNSERIMRIDNFCFFDEKLNELEIFLIPEERRAFPYVTEGLKNIIEENGLTGFRFELVSE